MKIALNLAAEDELSEHVIRRLARENQFQIAAVHRKGGMTYLKQRILAFNQASRIKPYLVLTDLDRCACPTELIEDWFRCSKDAYLTKKRPELLFCIAVREVESWLLADQESCARFLGIPVHWISSQPDQITDPKRELINLAARSRSRKVREEIAPRRGSHLRTGPGYNEQLGFFAGNTWRPDVAAQFSPSLRRTIAKLQEFYKTRI